VGAVVFGCVFGEEALAWGAAVSGADIGEDLDWFVVWRVVDYTDADFVC